MTYELKLSAAAYYYLLWVGWRKGKTVKLDPYC